MFAARIIAESEWTNREKNDGFPSQDVTRVPAKHVVRVVVLTLFFALSATAEPIPFRVDRQQSATQTAQETPAGSSSPNTAAPPLIQTMAQHVAESVQKSKRKKVIIFDFVGPDISSSWGLSGRPGKKSIASQPSRTVTMLGRSLASEFDAALGQLLPNVDVRSWNQFDQTLTADNFMPTLVEDPTTALWATSAARFDLFVWGDFEYAPGDKLELRLFCYRVRDGRAIEGLQVPISLSPDAKKLASIAAKETMHANYPVGGKNGITFPQCLSCRQAVFPRDAIGQVDEGTVILEAVITADGRAKDIKVVRGLSYGFTENAIEAVRHWSFQPARGPDGKPTPVRQIIMITFHIG